MPARAWGPSIGVVATLSWLLSLAAVGDAAVALGRLQFGQAIYTAREDFGVAVIAVQRHLGSQGRAGVFVSTVLQGGGNAIAGHDYVALYNRSLIWQDGEDVDKELYVRVLNDLMPQAAPKTFTLYLHDATGAELNMDRARTQVVLAPPTNLLSGSFRFLSRSLVVVENSSAIVQIPVAWDGGTTSTARVAYEIVCETACAPQDFTVLSPPILEWTRGGAVVQSIRMVIIDDDVYEPSETFSVRLLPPSELSPVPGSDQDVFDLIPATLGNISSLQVTIQGPNSVHGGVLQFKASCFPACRPDTYRLMDAGVAMVQLQRRNGSDGAAQVRVKSVDDTARVGLDYFAVDELVTWADGDAADKRVVVRTKADVVRAQSVQFRLVLSEYQGGKASAWQADQATIEIAGPSGKVLASANFMAPSRYGTTLLLANAPFLSLVTRFDSGLYVCPRVVVRKPGNVTLFIARAFGNTYDAASVTLRTVSNTAQVGVDFTALTPAQTILTWDIGDRSLRSVTLSVLDPPAYYVGKRSFFVEISAVDGVALGDCHSVEIILDAISAAPHIISFDLDMNAGKLALRLTDPVLAQTLNASTLILHSNATWSSSTERFRLSQTTTTASADGATIVLDLVMSDLNSLKRFTNLAKTSATTFLSARGATFQFIYAQCLGAAGPGLCRHAPFGAPSPIPRPAMAVTSLVTDTIRPVLWRYTIDLPQKLLKLNFSEPVNPRSLQLEALIFSDTLLATNQVPLSSRSSSIFAPQPHPLSGVRYGDGNPLPEDSTFVTILLGDADLAALKAAGNGRIGSVAASTFLQFTERLIEDFAIPPNKVQPVPGPSLATFMQPAPANCSVCPSNTYLSSSCSDTRDRVCSPCRVCPSNSFALQACTPLVDTVCYPCTECSGGQYASAACTSTSDRVCSSCTKCTMDEYEASPCSSGVDRVCRTCASCTLTKAQQGLCQQSYKWKRLQMKAPYGCPLASQEWQTLEARLQRQKSNRCGAGRCSCTGKGIGNANPNGDSFPDDPRCTGPAAYNILL